MKVAPSAYSHDEDDYEQDFSDGGNIDDEGIDEMERIRNAMAREKAKAEKFHERQQQSNIVTKRDTN